MKSEKRKEIKWNLLLFFIALLAAQHIIIIISLNFLAKFMSSLFSSLHHFFSFKIACKDGYSLMMRKDDESNSHFALYTFLQQKLQLKESCNNNQCLLQHIFIHFFKTRWSAGSGSKTYDYIHMNDKLYFLKWAFCCDHHYYHKASSSQLHWLLLFCSFAAINSKA